MTKLVFTGREERDVGCGLPPPIVNCQPCHSVCEDKCANKCAPRARAADTIPITMMERERCFSLSEVCSSEVLKSHLHCFRLEVRRRGLCDILSVETPYKALPSGAMCVVWSDEFLALEEGYYEADIFMDCTRVATVALHKLMPSLVVTSVPADAVSDCGPPICEPCCGVAPDVDQEVVVETGCATDCDGDCDD